MPDLTDTATLEWLIGILVAVGGGVGTIFLNIYGRIDSVKNESEEGDKALWAAFEKERDSTRDYRESIIKQLGAVPTKDDLANMETRIMAALTRNHSAAMHRDP